MARAEREVPAAPALQPPPLREQLHARQLHARRAQLVQPRGCDLGLGMGLRVRDIGLGLGLGLGFGFGLGLGTCMPRSSRSSAAASAHRRTSRAVRNKDSAGGWWDCG